MITGRRLCLMPRVFLITVCKTAFPLILLRVTAVYNYTELIRSFLLAFLNLFEGL